MPLRVTIDLVPSGVEQHKQTLFEFYIINDGTGNNRIGHYYSRGTVWQHAIWPKERQGLRIQNYPRGNGALGLTHMFIGQLLAQVIPEPNPKDKDKKAKNENTG